MTDTSPKKNIKSSYQLELEKIELGRVDLISKCNNIQICFQKASYIEKVKLFAELLDTFEKNIELIYFKYNTIQEQVSWLKFKNAILVKCLEFNVSGKKDFQKLCKPFLSKHFRCQQTTKRGSRCIRIIKPIPNEINVVLSYMIILENKHKDFSISLDEIEELSHFRKYKIDLCYCKLHFPKEYTSDHGSQKSLK